MAEFLDPLNVIEVDDVFFQVADHPFRYQSDLAADMITVPVGFRTDFASVPRFGWVYSIFGNIAHQAAVIHDWLYYAGITSRKQADRILLEAMEVTGIGWRQYPIYWQVRQWGWEPWNAHRKAHHNVRSLMP